MAATPGAGWKGPAGRRRRTESTAALRSRYSARSPTSFTPRWSWGRARARAAARRRKVVRRVAGVVARQGNRPSLEPPQRRAVVEEDAALQPDHPIQTR